MVSHSQETLGFAGSLSGTHCSLGAGDNWTHLVSNLTSLEPSRFRKNISKWLGLGTAPEDQLAVFLHEAIHHWTFNTPVARTISALCLRAREGVQACDGRN